MYKKILVFAAMIIAVGTSAFAMCGTCGSKEEGQTGGKNMFSQVSKEAAIKDGVKEIRYDQFMKIRNSCEKYVLLDVLSPESYNKGHIEGALSFPLETINKDTAKKNLSKDDSIVVYCGSFQCAASTGAAKKLSALGYDILDYKGGLKEWQEKRGKFIKN